jgi:hypothetical protein
VFRRGFFIAIEAQWHRTIGYTASTTTSKNGTRTACIYETPAICRQLAHARAVFKEAIAEKPSGRFMIRSRTRVVKRHPEGDW